MMRLLLALCATAAAQCPGSPRRFVVLTQPRSGSTWFVKYSEHFARASGVVTLGEIMHPEIVDRMMAGRNATRVRYDIDVYMRYLRGVFSELRCGVGWRGELGRHVAENDTKTVPPPRAVGFKLMYHQLPKSSAENGAAVLPGAKSMLGRLTLDSLLEHAARENVLYVHLMRLNHLERFITMTAITTFGLDYHRNDGSPTSYSRSSEREKLVMVSSDEAFMFACAQTKQNWVVDAYLKRACRALGAECLSLQYESLLGPGGRRVFADLRDHLGVQMPSPAQTATSLLPGNYDENAWVPCARRVANWEELRRHPQLGRTVWVAMCLSGNELIPEEHRYGNFSIFVESHVFDDIAQRYNDTDVAASKQRNHEAFRHMVQQQKRGSKRASAVKTHYVMTAKTAEQLMDEREGKRRRQEAAQAASSQAAPATAPPPPSSSSSSSFEAEGPHPARASSPSSATPEESHYQSKAQRRRRRAARAAAYGR